LLLHEVVYLHNTEEGKIYDYYCTPLTQAIDIILLEDRYTKREFLDAAKLGEVSMIDAKHVVSLLDEVREKNKI
jgi:hypothetical protein